jgi:hypothetical protein
MVYIAKYQVILSKFADMGDVVLGMCKRNWLTDVFSCSKIHNIDCRDISTEKHAMIIKLAATHWCTGSRYLPDWALLYQVGNSNGVVFG